VNPDPSPTFSIVTPSFNHAAFLEATIQSVLSQDYPPAEYRVMDGGSTDDSVSILRKFDSRLSWSSGPDDGQADAVNKGIAQTHGEIVGWLNSDDTYASGALSAILGIFSRHPEVGVVYGDADFIDADGSLIAPCAHIEPFNRSRLLHYGDFVVQPAAFFRRSVFDQVGGLDASLHWAMDYDFWLKAANLTEFFYLPRVLAHYRWLGSNKTGTGGEARFGEIRAVVNRYGKSGLPALVQLEAASFHLDHGQMIRAGMCVLSSPRAMWSLLSPRTWKMIRTQRVLRRSTKLTPAAAG
jgi:glycosyltransferase involved in cell wall biosynthesis